MYHLFENIVGHEGVKQIDNTKFDYDTGRLS